MHAMFPWSDGTIQPPVHSLVQWISFNYYLELAQQLEHWRCCISIKIRFKKKRSTCKNRSTLGKWIICSNVMTTDRIAARRFKWPVAVRSLAKAVYKDLQEQQPGVAPASRHLCLNRRAAQVQQTQTNIWPEVPVIRASRSAPWILLEWRMEWTARI